MKLAKVLAPLSALAICIANAIAADAPAPSPADLVPSASTAAVSVPIVQPFTAPGVQPIPYPKTSSTAMLTLYLVLLLVLLGGGAWLVRNGFTLFQPKVKGARKLLISETRMLGNRQFLIVAEYEDRKMLLGVCPGRIDYLATLGAPETEFSNLEPEPER